MDQKKPFHEIVAEELIEKLKAGTAPWQKPWNPGEQSEYLPMNPTSGKRYKGINAMHLMCQGRNDPRWMTYKQAGDVGAQVRKGEKGTLVQYWKFNEEQTQRDEQGKPVLGEDGKPKKETVELERPRVFFATVFNAEQIDGLPPLQVKQKDQEQWDGVERAEKILKASGAVINHVAGDRAFYKVSTDQITMPERSQFDTADRYYATALHELGHWTGHKSRLDRDLGNPFGSEAYAKEELRAEIASMILGSELGIGHDPGQHVAYVGSWIKAIKEDNLEIFRAAADAEKIQSYVLAFEQQQTINESVRENAIDQSALAYLSKHRGLDALTNEHKDFLAECSAKGDAPIVGAMQLGDAFKLPYTAEGVTYSVVSDLVHYGRTMIKEESLTFLDQGVGHVGGREMGRFTIAVEGSEFGHLVGANFSERSAAVISTFRKDGNVALEPNFEQLLQDLKSLPDAVLVRTGMNEVLGSEILLAEQATDRELSIALSADIKEVLDDPSVTFEHFVAFQGDTLEDALRSKGFNTVGSVTGNDPNNFNATAWDRLSPVFGIEPEHEEMGNPYLERKGLAQAFMLKAEQIQKSLERSNNQDEVAQHGTAVTAGAIAEPNISGEKWALSHVQKGTLIPALDGASSEQVVKVIGVLESMFPLNTQNEFWSRHELPIDVDDLDTKLVGLDEAIENRRLDGVIADAKRTGDVDAMIKASEEAFGVPLPKNWTGEVLVQGNITTSSGGEVFFEPAAASGKDPEFWGVYARTTDGKFEWMADFEKESQAEELLGRLAVIDANSDTNEFDKAAKLARVKEWRIRQNPNSTDDEISAAKENRKAAEATAMLNESNQPKQQQEEPTAAKSERTYIDVPFREKDEAKSLGARWDRQQQSWYVPAGADLAQFQKWTQVGSSAAPEASDDKKGQHQPEGLQDAPKASSERVYLAVPFGEKAAAKSAGAMWDKGAKSWFAGPGSDMERLKRWLPENVPVQQGPAMTPQEEFGEALKSLGCVVSGDHPIMDGKKHRISVEGDKSKERSGFYVGHLDIEQGGHPAGYVKNNRTGVEMRWKSKGYTLSDEEKAKLRAEAAEKLANRAAEQDKRQEAKAQQVSQQAAGLLAIEEPTPYLRDKGVSPSTGILTDSEGKKTYIPAFDADGKQWSMQYIQEDGTKRFAKDSKKEGCFHPVGGMEALAAAPVLVIAEGYATARTLSEVIGHATAAAFDSGNLMAVATALHEKYPDKPILIAGDDDRHLSMTQGNNPGREKAEEAARSVGGKAIFPVFGPGENSYPADLAKITPQSYRAHDRAQKRLDNDGEGINANEKMELQKKLLSEEQIAALSGMRKHTDFNDLATRSVLGREGVERQVKAAISQEEAKAKENKPEEQQQLKKSEKQSNESDPPRGAVRI